MCLSLSVGTGAVVLAVVAGVTVAGLCWAVICGLGDAAEPLGVAQGALLGVVALVLAFGLTLAVGRYEVAARRWSRRRRSGQPTCGLSYSRSLSEVGRSRCCATTPICATYLSEVPGSPAMSRTITQRRSSGSVGLRGRAIDAAPVRGAAAVCGQPEHDDRPASVRISGLSSGAHRRAGIELAQRPSRSGAGVYLSLLGRGSCGGRRRASDGDVLVTSTWTGRPGA